MSHASCADQQCDLPTIPTPPRCPCLQDFKEVSDPILAYSFIYPIQSATGRGLNMIMSRAPEKYSSAAPLAADARQRIVSELIDPSNFVTVSVTVGPAAGLLKDKQPSEWKPRDVAFQVRCLPRALVCSVTAAEPSHSAASLRAGPTDGTCRTSYGTCRCC
jgi:hypothetical protein